MMCCQNTCADATQVEGEAEEAEDTLAGVTVGALRNWMRQVRILKFPSLKLVLHLLLQLQVSSCLVEQVSCWVNGWCVGR